MKKILFLFMILVLSACRNDPQKKLDNILSQGDTLSINYATGFEMVEYDGFKLLTVKNAWPKAEKEFTYLLVEKGTDIPKGLKYDEKITVPVEEIVVTSTTHIPWKP